MTGDNQQENNNNNNSDEVQRWTVKRKTAVVLDIIKGRTTPAAVARAHALTVAEVEAWVDDFMRGGAESLRARPRDVEAMHEAEKKELHAKIGELTLQIDVLKKAERIAEELSRRENSL